MVEHSLITDPYIHEPKGAASASEGMIYVANGSGSGIWTLWPLGRGVYAHSSTGQIINTTPSKLIINGSGAGSVTNYLPREIRGTGSLWDATGNKITPIRVGDSYTVRIDIPVTLETGSPADFKLQVDVGGGATPTSVVFEKYFPTGKAAPYTISFDVSFVVVSAATVTNGFALFCSTNAGSVTLGSSRISIVKTGDGLL